MIRFTGFYNELVRLQNRTNNLGHLKLERYKSIVRETLRTIATASPQWSGYFAASWKVSVAGASRRGGDEGFAEDVGDDAAYDFFKADAMESRLPGQEFEAKQRGDEEAISYCMEANEPRIQGISKLSTRVTFVNGVDYAEIIAKNADPEDPDWALRPVNVTSPSPIPLGYAKQWLAGRYRKR